jgi:hypothetical protein
MMAKAVTVARRPAVGVGSQPVDRWGGTPLTGAEASGHGEVAALLREHAHEVATLPHRPHRSDKREAAVG